MSSNAYLTVRLHITETSKQLEEAYPVEEMGALAFVLQPTEAQSTGRNMYEHSRYTDQVTR
jgi:hypothetical protein